MEAFCSSREQFDAMVAKMSSAETASLSHGDLEELLQRDGQELLRRLLQDHLDLRSAREHRIAVVGADGVARNHHRDGSARRLETIFGTVDVRRLGYGKAGVDSVFPMDRCLNLPQDKYSHGLRRRLADEVARNSFDNAVQSLSATTGGHVPKRQAEAVTAHVAQDFDAFYEQRRSQEAEGADPLLVMSLDGKGIVMRTADLRPETREKAERQTGRKKRLGPGEKRNRKRMATVAAVYSVAEYHRTAEQIMGLVVEDEAIIRPRYRNKRVWASVEKSPEQVTDEVFREALRRDPDRTRRWLMLVDGDKHQIDRIRAAAKAHGVDVTIILDFIHVLEYLWDAGHAFFGEGHLAVEGWVVERAVRILQGKVSDVAAGIRRSATLQGLDGTRREAVDTCADYLLKNRDHLRYDLFLDGGFPISTGVIEGACRHLVKDRMDITGARWGLRSAEAVLRLRAMRSSGDLDAYWRFHRHQELTRNHTSRYKVYPRAVAA